MEEEMIEVTFDNQDMILSVKGSHKLWTLKSELRIPLAHVQQAQINNGEISRPIGWKAPGTYIPGIITAGTFRAHGEKVFWDVVDKEKTIIINLQNDDYKQIVIEVENPKTSIDQINKRIA
jgi:hypothetical protein